MRNLRIRIAVVFIRAAAWLLPPGDPSIPKVFVSIPTRNKWVELLVTEYREGQRKPPLLKTVE